MRLEQTQNLSQKLALTQTMRQSLDCLQLSAPELCEYVQELALSNPLLDVQAPTYYETELPGDTVPPEREAVELRESENGFPSPPAGEGADIGAYPAGEKSFRDELNEQIGQLRLVDGRLLGLCRFLIGCLDERGYLDCPLEELAEETGYPVSELEQALYAVQMLEPPGVGARSLSECLTLQLAQGKAFNRLTLAIARGGLELLGKRDYAGLAAMLGVSVSEAKRSAEEILALSPIPSRGFAGGAPAVYIAPDAVFRAERGRLVIELNERILPRLSVNGEYAALLSDSGDPEVQRYIREKLAEAQALIKGVRARCDTLTRLIALLGETQEAFFLRGGDLAPVTMQQFAGRLGVSVSTVSRAVQNKYLQFQGRLLPLRGFFTTALRSDAAISNQVVKQRIKALIRDESPASPLSDEALRLALSEAGIAVSRRAVAKYRAALGIPSSTARRRG